MKFSIITPCYNCVDYIEECIRSIMNQTYGEYEHIIVDGGSTDGTIDVIRRYEGCYNMRWISEKDEGMYDAINKGFLMADGDVYSWLNADDFYMPWALTAVATAMKAHREIKWLTGIPSSMNSDGILYFRKECSVNAYSRKAIAKGQHHGRGKGCIQQESTFWKKELWNTVKGLNPSYKIAGDFDLWRRFAENEQLYTVNTILASFRIHGGQKSEDYLAYCEEIREYCTLRNFTWWAFNKFFPLQKIYNKRNSKKIVSCIDVENRTQKMDGIKQYVFKFLLKRQKFR